VIADTEGNCYSYDPFMEEVPCPSSLVWEWEY
jgi:hypothetical protein